MLQTYDAASISRMLDSMPDTRPMRCRDHAYEFHRLEVNDVQLSIVSHFSGADDLADIKLTLTSIVLHTPYDLYEEIVVIDDGTESLDDQQTFGTFLQDSRFNKASLSLYCQWRIQGDASTSWLPPLKTWCCFNGTKLCWPAVECYRRRRQTTTTGTREHSNTGSLHYL